MDGYLLCVNGCGSSRSRHSVSLIIRTTASNDDLCYSVNGFLGQRRYHSERWRLTLMPIPVSMCAWLYKPASSDRLVVEWVSEWVCLSVCLSICLCLC